MYGKIKETLRNTCTVNKFLMIIMLILIMQLAYSVFFSKINTQDTSSIDTIIRTSAATIFGYFLSGNFAGKGANTNSVTPAEGTELTAGSGESDLKNKIGFDSDGGGTQSSLQSGEIKIYENSGGRCGKLQVTVVSVICILSLLILILLRNYGFIGEDAAVTVSQLRDFVSACVGFLVGCDKNKGI